MLLLPMVAALCLSLTVAVHMLPFQGCFKVSACGMLVGFYGIVGGPRLTLPAYLSQQLLHKSFLCRAVALAVYHGGDAAGTETVVDIDDTYSGGTTIEHGQQWCDAAKAGAVSHGGGYADYRDGDSSVHH